MEIKPYLSVSQDAATCRLGHQRGAVAIMQALTMIVLVGFCAISLDLSRLYNRKAELQSLADAVALAAARELDGTQAGVTRALTRARDTAEAYQYGYNKYTVSWSNAAIAFGPTRNGGWVDSGAAAAAPQAQFFVRVDLGELDEAMSVVDGMFMQFLDVASASGTVNGRAVAGRATTNVTPFGICAMSASEATARANPGPPANVELVQYGFRRGVAYNLMRLNPNGDTPEFFFLSPIDPPGTLGQEVHAKIAVVGPFLCTGTMSMARVTGAPIRITRPLPGDTVFNQLNSRFDQYPVTDCHPNGAPPDTNVRSYTFNPTPWMNTAPGAPEGQTAREHITPGSRLETVADPDPAPATNTAAMYGPLWSFARAVPFSAYSAGVPEPPTGYATFGTSAWSTLYRPGQPAATGSYPSTTPYSPITGANFQPPSAANGPGLRHRRVLHIPLIQCPVPASATSATVLAVGRFFMTVPATATSISGEFAGLASAQSLTGAVELYP
ncbi:MAG: pilus assembly protein TadG-related protein [Telluria sp.]